MSGEDTHNNASVGNARTAEEQERNRLMKAQLERSKQQLKEATSIKSKFDSMTEILALEEGLTLDEAREKSRSREANSFGIAFEDGSVETTRRRKVEEEIQRFASQSAEFASSNSAQPSMAPENLPVSEQNTGASFDLHPEALPWLQYDGETLFQNTENPFEGFEDKLLALCTRADGYAWHRAISFYPQEEGLSPDLLKAFVRRNLMLYTRNGLIEDYLISTGQHSRHDVPIGFAQLTSGKVLQLEEQYPVLAAFFAGAGYIGAAHESLVLLDPTCVPAITATLVASIVDDLVANNIAVNDWTVAYALNPDVYSFEIGEGARKYAVLEGLDVSLSKVKHWDQRLETRAFNDEIVSVSQQIKFIVAQIVRLANI
ncbi:MAG: hypothetical protein IAF58_03380 [Leptolyngbya sp.]|nr:hypothetical protein [Candidatus Melainabacteria bacterium]